MLFVTIISVLVFSATCENNNETVQFNATGSTPDAVTVSTTTPSPPKNTSCPAYHNDCKGCVANSQCYYCDTDNKCNIHIENFVSKDECSMNQVHYLTCRVNFQYMMIIIGVLVGIVLLVITAFCCYCCCKKKGIKISKDELKWARQREERKQVNAEKRRERSERSEEIRKKYGLVRDSNPYQKFDA